MLMKHRRETAGGIEPKQNGQDVDGDAVPHEIRSGGHPPRGGDGGERTAEDNQTSDNRPAATQGRRDYDDHKDGIKQSVTASDVTQSEDGATLRSGMQGAVSGMGGVVGERVSEVSDVIQERVSDWSGALQETVSDLGDVIQERVSEAGQAVDQAAAGLKGMLADGGAESDVEGGRGGASKHSSRATSTRGRRAMDNITVLQVGTPHWGGKRHRWMRLQEAPWS